MATAVAFAVLVAGAVDFVNDRQSGGSDGKKPAEKVAKTVGNDKEAAPPRHVVAIRRAGEAVSIRDARTGANVGVDAAAPQGQRWHQVASAGNGSYVLSAYSPGRITFYRLTLSEDGAPRKLAQIPGLAVRGASSAARSDMAVSEDGKRIAYVAYGAGGVGRIEIASAKAADRRQWAASSPGRVSSLSWAGDTLSFVWTTVRGTAVRRQVRTLDTTAAGADLRVSKPVLMLPEGGTAAVLNGDGTTIVAGVRAASGLSLQEFSAATGRRTKVLWTREAGRSGELSGLTRHSEGGHVLAAGTEELVYAVPGKGVRGVPAEGYADVAW
ncbi:hypothetical protein [Thermomonospora echinospora]|uniref:hypothetical protein n=1 Tax=Thermomonospora echinospora TaxID=1992 RepID=UPI0011AFFDCB|nr:hypothetical protein [Thermomonospora echinospora]